MENTLSFEQKVTIALWWLIEPLRYDFYQAQKAKGLSPLSAYWKALDTPWHFL